MLAKNAQRRVSYTVNPDVKVVLHWTNGALPSFNIRALGVRRSVQYPCCFIIYNHYFFRGEPWIVGFCLPKGVAGKPVESYLDFSFKDHNKDHSDIKVAASLDTLEADDTGLNTFIDTDKG